MVDKSMVHKFSILIFSKDWPWKMAQRSINQNITQGIEIYVHNAPVTLA